MINKLKNYLWICPLILQISIDKEAFDERRHLYINWRNNHKYTKKGNVYILNHTFNPKQIVYAHIINHGRYHDLYSTSQVHLLSQEEYDKDFVRGELYLKFNPWESFEREINSILLKKRLRVLLINKLIPSHRCQIMRNKKKFVKEYNKQKSEKEQLR